ncbi:MAG TPA: TetR family transcriptional regulator [Micromonosporaceae bacterium]
MFSMVNMRSLPDDRTARARIRDEALRLFGERGPDAVTLRDVAATAGVSPALVVRHYGSKDGLRASVDEYVAQVFETLLVEAVEPAAAAPFDEVPALAEMVAAKLPAASAIPTYLGRMLLTGGAGSTVFRRLYDVSRGALARMAAAGTAEPGADPEVRAAFLLVNDLAVLILRDRLGEVLGVDPLSAAGMRRWGAEVLSIYRDGLGTRPTRAGQPPANKESR